MEARAAYKQVLSLMSEKTAVSVVDSLSNAEYYRKEMESVVLLSERLKEASFTFGVTQLDKQAAVLARGVEELDDFLLKHYEPLDKNSFIFQLYPRQKHEQHLKTAEGKTVSWFDLRDEGVKLAREVLKEYLKLVHLCQNQLSSQKRDYKFIHKIPAGTRWEDFVMIFTVDDRLRVKVKQFDESLGFEDMGFADGRTGKPTIQWELLRLFAKNNGEIDPTNSEAQDRYKKQKQLLSQKLQTFFSIDFDPFEPYEGAYKTKFTIFLKEE